MANEIIYKQLDDLKPYENNPRRNENAIDKVANSIKEFGFKVPIVIDRDGVIVAGHTRYQASRKLGMDTVPCIVADDLTDEQVKAFRLVDNKTSEFAAWDFEALDKELAELADWDMEDFGFANNNFVEFEDQLAKYGEGSMDVKGSSTDSFAVTLLFNNEYEEFVKEKLKEHKPEGLAYILIEALEEMDNA